MKNKINDLRDHLFATLEALRDEEKPMELERAREIANVARVIVDSAKAEVAFMQAAGTVRGTGFIPLAGEEGAPVGRQLSAGAVPIHICGDCKKRTNQDPCEHCGTAWKRVA